MSRGKNEESMRETEYKDRLILALRKKYAEKLSELESVGENILIEGKRIALHREWLLGEKCSVLLPEILKDMGIVEASARYRRNNRPQIIKAEVNGDAALTFSLVPIKGSGLDAMDSMEKLQKIREDTKKIWKQNVFYDEGKVQAGQLEIAWMDLKAFCLNGSLYSLIFLFDIQEEIVLGNFHCGFRRYDVWKPIILKLLTTLQIQEENYERLSD